MYIYINDLVESNKRGFVGPPPHTQSSNLHIAVWPPNGESYDFDQFTQKVEDNSLLQFYL